jgi:iron complex outermembrane receptor protein
MKSIHTRHKDHCRPGTQSLSGAGYIAIAAVLCTLLLVLGPVTTRVGHAQTDAPAPQKIAPAHNDTGATVTGNTVTLDEVTVVSRKIDDYIQKNPNQVVSMDAEEMTRRNFLEAYEVLGSMPGVDVRRGSSGMGARISIRGGGGSGSVLVLVDGRPMNSGQFSGVDLGSIPMDIIKKITVFKPPAPVWLGPGSSAGAIYIETKRGKTAKTATSSGRLRTGVGSFGRFDLNGSWKTSWEKTNLLLAAGYGRQDGHRKNSQRDKGHFSFNWDKETDSLVNIQVNGKYYLSDHGVSGPTYNPTPNARQRYEKGGLDMKLKGFMGDTLDYELKAFGDFTDLKDTSNTGEKANLDAFSSGAGGEIFWSNEAGDRELRMGSLVKTEQVDQTLTGEHDRTQVSVHAMHTMNFNPFVFTMGIREDYSNDFDFSPAGNLGLSYEVMTDLLVKTSLGYTTNLPSFGQLYQPSHGSIDQVRGNPDLQEEKITTWSMGIQKSFKKKSYMELTAFRTDSKDLIKYQRGEDLISRPENVDNAWKQGMEATFKYKFGKGLSLDLNHVWQRTENEDNGKDLSYAPEHSFKATVKSKLKGGTRLESSLRAYSRQFTDTENTSAEAIHGYATVDAKVIEPITLSGRSGEVYLHLINLLDRDYSSHYGYPDDGIRFVCGLNINF